MNKAFEKILERLEEKAIPVLDEDEHIIPESNIREPYEIERVALSDIKNDNLKLALVNANMYFNEQGRLVKKIEKAANTDINGDGKIDTTDYLLYRKYLLELYDFDEIKYEAAKINGIEEVNTTGYLYMRKYLLEIGDIEKW